MPKEFLTSPDDAGIGAGPQTPNREGVLMGRGPKFCKFQKASFDLNNPPTFISLDSGSPIVDGTKLTAEQKYYHPLGQGQDFGYVKVKDCGDTNCSDHRTSK